MKNLGASLFLLALILAGCSSYVSSPEKESKLTSYQRFFVKSNFDDNHGVDVRIVRALQDRGFTAERGPMTMMPDKTQAVVTYEDRWNWDFKTHLTYLRIIISDARSGKVAASGFFNGPAAIGTSTEDAIERLLKRLFTKTQK